MYRLCGIIILYVRAHIFSKDHNCWADNCFLNISITDFKGISSWLTFWILSHNKLLEIIFLKWWSIYLFIYGCVGSSFTVRGLSLVTASGGHSSSRCAGLPPSRPLLLRSTSSRHAGSVIVAHGPSCSAACGILPDQGSNLCPLHWQADSQPLRHQGSP